MDERDGHRHGPGTASLVLLLLSFTSLAWFGPVAAPAAADDPPPSSPTSGPSLAVIGGTETVVWRGQDGAVWTSWGTSPGPGSARSLGGNVLDAPDIAALADGGGALVARGADGAAWLRVLAASGTWGGWRSLGGQLLSAPAVTSWGPGRLDVTAVGTDRQVWHTWSNDRGATWGGWEPLGGQLTSAVDTSSWGPGRLDIVGRGTDGAVWQRAHDGAWRGWVSYGGQIDSAPAIVDAWPGTLFILARGTDGGTWWRSNGVGWARRDGAIAGDPEAAVVGGTPTFTVLGTDQSVWTARGGGGWTRRTWTEPPRIGWPAGALETMGVQYADRVVLSGWATDESAPTQGVTVDVVVDGTVTASVVAERARGDVGAHGFDLAAPAPAGSRQVCVIARDIGVGEDTTLGCRSLAAPSGGGYTFMATEARGHPVRFDPCRRIPIVFNPAGGPSWAAAELDAAVAQLRSATGLDLVVEGTTTEPATTTRTSTDVARYGPRWSPILVGFSSPSLLSALNGGVVGLGGPVAVTGPDGRVTVTGLVVIDGPQVLGLAIGWDGASLRKVFAHELGHVVGLGHSPDPTQLLAPVIPARPGAYGSGDLAGLQWLGAAQGCRRVPAPPGTAATAGIDETPLDEQLLLETD